MSGNGVTVCILSIQNSYVGVLTPGPQNVTLLRDIDIGDSVIARSLGQVLIKYDWGPYKKGKFEQRRTGKRHGKMKAELKVMHLQAKRQCAMLLAIHALQGWGSGWDRPSLSASGAPSPAHTLILDFQPLELRDEISVV